MKEKKGACLYYSYYNEEFIELSYEEIGILTKALLEYEMEIENKETIKKINDNLILKTIWRIMKGKSNRATEAWKKIANYKEEKKKKQEEKEDEMVDITEQYTKHKEEPEPEIPDEEIPDELKPQKTVETFWEEMKEAKGIEEFKEKTKNKKFNTYDEIMNEWYELPF